MASDFKTRIEALEAIEAVSTPLTLASIFGSVFLVIVPILEAAVGPYALRATAAVCAFAIPARSVIPA